MSDDFFTRIDKTLAERSAKQSAKEENQDSNRAFVKAIIPRLNEIADEYAEKLKSGAFPSALNRTAIQLISACVMPTVKLGALSAVCSPTCRIS